MKVEKVDFKKCPRHHYKSLGKASKSSFFGHQTKKRRVVRCRVGVVEPFMEVARSLGQVHDS